MGKFETSLLGKAAGKGVKARKEMRKNYDNRNENKVYRRR